MPPARHGSKPTLGFIFIQIKIVQQFQLEFNFYFYFSFMKQEEYGAVWLLIARAAQVYILFTFFVVAVVAVVCSLSFTVLFALSVRSVTVMPIRANAINVLAWLSIALAERQ